VVSRVVLPMLVLFVLFVVCCVFVNVGR
jgi:hypothetical protein